jgi:hypothetical protein
MRGNVQFAVIPAIQKTPAAALFSAQRMVATQGEKAPRPNAADADHGLMTAVADIYL